MPTTRALLLAMATGWVTVFSTPRARAQACCAGAAAVTPARLSLHENVLVGWQTRATALVGSFASQRQFVAAPAGTSEIGWENDLLAAVRVLTRGQLSVQVPFLVTWRRAGGRSEGGGGFGDVNVGGRYDVTVAGQSATLPGIGVLFGVSLPTGTPPDGAERPLATDTTGIGAWQGNAGVAVEQTFGHVYVGLNAVVGRRTARRVGEVTEQLGLQLTALAAASYTFDNEATVGGSVAYTHEGSAVLNGASLDRSGREQWVLSTVGLWPLSDVWRLQGSVFAVPPVTYAGRNQPAPVGVNLAVLRTWS